MLIHSRGIDESIIDSPLLVHKEEIIRQAKKIRKKGQWVPLFFMIDKCRAEVLAILIGMYTPFYTHHKSAEHGLLVWPNAIIRICQFHVVQVRLSFSYFEGHSL